MSEYVLRCTLEANGKSIEDFKSVTEGEIELAKAVPLMNSTGTAGKLERPSCSVDYVLPKDGPEFDWEHLLNGTLTIVYDSGTRVEYSGVRTAKIGEAKIDGENEVVRKIDLLATTRTKR